MVVINYLSEILHTRGGPLCIPFKPPSTQICIEVPRSGRSRCGRIPSGLEQIDLSNPSSRSLSASGTAKDQRGSSNYSPPKCSELDRTGRVSQTSFRSWWITHCCYPAPIPVVSPITANSIPSPVEIPASDSLDTT